MIPLKDNETLALRLQLKAKARQQEETFTREEMMSALKSFIDYGEQTLRAHSNLPCAGHQGYFSGSGFAARAARHLYKQLKEGPPWNSK